MTKTTIPGSIPGLLRRGSPVIASDDILTGRYDYRAGVVISCVEIGKWIEVAFENDMFLIACQGDFELNLEDPTGRAHAIWWLANNAKIGSLQLDYICLKEISRISNAIRSLAQ